MRKALMIFAAMLLLLKVVVYFQDLSKTQAKLDQQKKQQQEKIKQSLPERGIRTDTDTTVYAFLPNMPYLKECESEERAKDCSDKKFVYFLHEKFGSLFILRENIHRINVSFIIEKDGSMSTFKTKDVDLSPNFEEVIRTFPKWIPGSKNGQPKRVKFRVPINITLGR